MKYGLSEKQLKEIIQIFSSYKEIDEAILFGSRAKGTHKESSDVDIVIKGKEITYSYAAKLKSHLEDDTYLPYFFDIIAYKTITSEELKEHIRIYGKTIMNGSKKITKGWQEVKLGDVAELSKTPWKLFDEPYPYIGLEHINENKLRLNGIGDSNSVASNKYRFNSGDILFGKLRPYFRKVVLAKFDDICSTDIWVVKPKDKTDNVFLFYFFANPVLVDISYSSSSGTRMPRADWNFLADTLWQIPPLPEQKAIAGVLSSLDDKIDLLYRQNKTLEDIAQTIFKEWFGKYKVGDELPNGWRVGKLEDMIKLHSGFAFKSKDFIEGGKFGLVTIKNVQAGFFVRETRNKLDFIHAKIPDYCKLKTGDILLSLTGNVGRVCHVIGENYLLNQRVAKIEAKNKNDSSFVYLFFRQPIILKLLENIASGTAQQNLSPIKTQNLDIIIPSRKSLDEFAELVNQKIKKTLFNLEQTNTLTNTRDTLLPKLMSGEVRFSLK